jgi:hypothetical protein
MHGSMNILFTAMKRLWSAAPLRLMAISLSLYGQRLENWAVRIQTALKGDTLSAIMIQRKLF